MANKYASRTRVTVESSKMEIEKTMKRYGCDCFGTMSEPGKAMVAFRFRDRFYRMSMPVPEKTTAEKQAWRVLLLLLKAKMESVLAEVTTPEQEFMAWTLLPDGKTVSEAIDGQIEQAYLTGEQPKILLIGS